MRRKVTNTVEEAVDNVSVSAPVEVQIISSHKQDMMDLYKLMHEMKINSKSDLEVKIANAD